MTRVVNGRAYPPGATDMDAGYDSDFNSSHCQSGSNDWSSDITSGSDRSRETPPYFNEQCIRGHNYTTVKVYTSSMEQSVSQRTKNKTEEKKTEKKKTEKNKTEALKKEEPSPGEVLVFFIVVVAITFFAFRFFSKEASLNQDVKIVLPDSSGEVMSATETYKLLKEIITQLKQEVEDRVRAEIRAEGGTSQASGLVCFIKLVFLVLSALFILVISPDFSKTLQKL